MTTKTPDLSAFYDHFAFSRPTLMKSCDALAVVQSHFLVRWFVGEESDRVAEATLVCLAKMQRILTLVLIFSSFAFQEPKLFAVVADQPIRVSRRSALWCVECIQRLWNARGNKISQAERDEALRTYEDAKAIYRRIATEAPEGS